ncbi:MAG: NAD(P)-binding protein [Chlorobi bacterium]|nr:NAD(P)-binding protein [Chlorobiota bacterium]
MAQYIIIGAGISGLSAARLLKEQGEEVLILERASKPGGLIKCDIVDGHLFHRVGGHVFNTKIQKVKDWFWKHFDRNNEFISATRQAGIYLHNRYLSYPLENNLYKFDEDTVKAIVSELLELEKVGKRKFSNFEDFLKGNFGETLYNIYFKPYNEKIWKTDLSKVALPWLDGKLPMPDHKEIITSNILRKEETNMVHSSFFYPYKSGSQFIADRLSEDIEITYNIEVESLEYKNKHWIVNSEFEAENIIYTGDIRKLHDFIKLMSSSLKNRMEQVKELKSNGTSNLLCTTDDTTYSWLYLPDKDIPSHRIIYTGNFSKTNYPEGQRKSCTVEFSGNTPLEEMKKTISKLPGNLEIVDHNYEPNSYVIQQNGDRDKIKSLKKELAEYNFHLVGRFAEWEYFNMDKAIESAMNTVAAILKQNS